MSKKDNVYEVQKLKKQLLVLRFKRALGELKNTSMESILRKKIASLKLVLNKIDSNYN
jgi:ribosomal protein L29